MSKKKIKIRDNDPESAREINLYDNPIPSRELILQVMSEHGIPINKKELLESLEIKDDEIYKYLVDKDYKKVWSGSSYCSHIFIKI